MALRDILCVPNPLLTSPSREVSDAQHPEVQGLLRDMKDTVIAAGGIGLAAPQVGISLRVMVVNEHGAAAPYGLINPRIVWSSKGTSVLEEGCLSIPDVTVPVRRPRKVRVSALDEHGGEVEIRGSDLLAKILQHEIDHLNGVLITDYVSSAPRGDVRGGRQTL